LPVLVCLQICSSTSRLLVHESIADAFFRQLKKRAESIKVSGGVDQGQGQGREGRDTCNGLLRPAGRR
jgi:hypothetical protein